MRYALAAIAGLALAAPHAAAAANPPCYPLDKIEELLGSEYGEKRSFAGKEDTKGVEYRLYVNLESGSWSWIGIPAGSQLGCLLFVGNRHDSPTTPSMPETAESPSKTSPTETYF